jgi:hypothetical protein
MIILSRIGITTSGLMHAVAMKRRDPAATAGTALFIIARLDMRITQTPPCMPDTSHLDVPPIYRVRPHVHSEPVRSEHGATAAD